MHEDQNNQGLTLGDADGPTRDLAGPGRPAPAHPIWNCSGLAGPVHQFVKFFGPARPMT